MTLIWQDGNYEPAAYESGTTGTNSRSVFHQASIQVSLATALNVLANLNFIGKP